MLWKVKVMVIIIAAGVFGTDFNDLEKKLGELGIKGRINTPETAAQLK